MSVSAFRVRFRFLHFLPGSSEPLSSVALQFLVLVFPSTESCSNQPQCVSPTLIGGSCVAISSGATFTTQIIASSRAEGVSITDFQITECETCYICLLPPLDYS